MTSSRRKELSPQRYAAMFAFLDAFADKTYPDDVGGFFGQLTFLRDHPPCGRADEPALRKAVSIAVTAH